MHDCFGSFLGARLPRLRCGQGVLGALRNEVKEEAEGRGTRMEQGTQHALVLQSHGLQAVSAQFHMGNVPLVGMDTAQAAIKSVANQRNRKGSTRRSMIGFALGAGPSGLANAAAGSFQLKNAHISARCFWASA